MSRFKRVRTKAELDALINTVTKNKQKLQNEVTEEVVGKEVAKQVAKQGAQAQASPITAELQNVVKKIDEVLNTTQMVDKVPGKPWLGQTDTFIDPDTGKQKKEQKNLLTNITNAIKNNRKIFKKVLKEIVTENKNIITALGENKQGVTDLAIALGTDINSMIATIGTISAVLNSNPDNVISLLKSNIKETKNVTKEIKKLYDTKPEDTLTDIEIESEDDSEFEDLPDEVPEDYASSSTSSTSTVTPGWLGISKVAPSSTASNIGVINSTSSSKVTPNPAIDTNDEREEKLQEERVINQLNELKKLIPPLPQKSYSLGNNKEKTEKFVEDHNLNTINDAELEKQLQKLDLAHLTNYFIAINKEKGNEMLKDLIETYNLNSSEFKKALADDVFLLIKENLQKNDESTPEKKTPQKNTDLFSTPSASTPSNSFTHKQIETIITSPKPVKNLESLIKGNLSPEHKKQIDTEIGLLKSTPKKNAAKRKAHIKAVTNIVNTYKRGSGIGSGRHYDPYKMDGNGIMGKLQIDKPLLNRLLLRVHKDGQQIAYQPIPHDLVELLTKKYNSRKQYHPDAIELFKKLVRHSEIPFDAVRNAKFKNILSNMHESDIGKGFVDPITKAVIRSTYNKANLPVPEQYQGFGINKCKCDSESDEEAHSDSVRIMSSPEEAFNRLNILLGEMQAGNTNESIMNEICQLLEYLHKHKEITDEGYKQLMEACKQL